MRKHFTKFLALTTVAVSAAVFTGCSSEDEPFADFESKMEVENPVSRAVVQGDSTIITFDDFESTMMAMPTSYGANYYGNTGSYAQVKQIKDPSGIFESSINVIGGSTAFYNGGLALSKWNYRSNPGNGANITGSGTGDWWYSYNNQMSVYNTTSTDGANVNAGHSGNNFAVVYGYQDFYNSQWMAKPSFSFIRKKTLKGLWFCNSSYTYGVIMKGNQFGASGVATPLSKQVDGNGNYIGYFQVELECYNENGELLATYVQTLADYRNGKKQDPVTTWTYWPINQANVKTVKLNFSGSDTGDYGLNTPAYICLDDITIE